jgi:uncharacterized protein (TIGR02246 family)
MTAIRISALAFVLALTATGAASAGARDGIEAALKTFADAFNGSDGAGVAAHYTEDAALLPPGEARVDGRAAVQAYWQGAIDGGITDLTLKAVEVEESGNLATEVGAFTLAVPGEGDQKTTVAGKYIVVWKKGADGAWRLHRDIWNVNPAE